LHAVSATTHNNFVARLDENGKLVSVFSGSTNFTPSVFLAQTNEGHLVTDDFTAKQYFDSGRPFPETP
jgi:hypothetical protein